MGEEGKRVSQGGGRSAPELALGTATYKMRLRTLPVHSSLHVTAPFSSNNGVLVGKTRTLTSEP